MPDYTPAFVWRFTMALGIYHLHEPPNMPEQVYYHRPIIIGHGSYDYQVTICRGVYAVYLTMAT